MKQVSIPQTESDTLAEVQARLQAAPFDTTHIKATLKHGVLYLTGVVADLAAKRDAKALVRSTEGILHVENGLTIEEGREVNPAPMAPAMPHPSDSQQNEPAPEMAVLWNVKELQGYTVQAIDGEAGRVSDFYFDEESWSVQQVVIDIGDWVLDTGAWIPGRKVVIPVDTFGLPYREGHILPVKLTKAQVEGSLEFESYVENGINLPLHSLKEVLGCHIEASDGEIGHVEDFIIDCQAWLIQRLIVDTRNWWPGKKVTLMPGWINFIDWTGSKVCVNLLQETIKNSPEFKASMLFDNGAPAIAF